MGTSSGATSAAPYACSRAVVSCTCTERRMPCEYMGTRVHRFSLMKAMCVRTPLRHASRRSCCASSTARSGDTVGSIDGSAGAEESPPSPSRRELTSVMSCGRVRSVKVRTAS